MNVKKNTNLFLLTFPSKKSKIAELKFSIKEGISKTYKIFVHRGMQNETLGFLTSAGYKVSVKACSSFIT